MEKKNKIHIILVILATALVLLLNSCTEVEYRDYVYSADSTRVSFLFDWEGIKSEPEYGIPDEMTVLMSRIINTVHYAWLTDNTGKILAELPDSTGTQASDTATAIDNGIYYLMAA